MAREGPFDVMDLAPLKKKTHPPAGVLGGVCVLVGCFCGDVFLFFILCLFCVVLCFLW